MKAEYVDARTLEQDHDAVGCTGSQDRYALRQASYGVGVEAIDVLRGRDPFDHLRFVDMLGQR